MEIIIVHQATSGIDRVGARGERQRKRGGGGVEERGYETQSCNNTNFIHPE